MHDLRSLPTEMHDECLLCTDAPVTDDARAGQLLGLIPPYQVKLCTACGLRWLSPRPTEQGYEHVYAAENYFSGRNAVESFDDLARIRRPYFRHRVKRIEALSNSQSALRMLDIGAATGEFVYEARQRGHAAEGFEFSADARQQARDKYSLELHSGNIETLADNEPYDVVHMNHVFEHVPDPRDTLSVIQRLLKAGGLLVIEVPQQFDNDLDRLKRLLRLNRKPEFNAYSLHHTWFFTPTTLTQLLNSYGFSVLHAGTANWARTPLWPPNPIHLILGTFLYLSDRIHRGGNVIEVYARN